MDQEVLRVAGRGALGLLMISLMSSTALAQEALPSAAEMWRIIQEQQRQLAEQRREIDALKAAAQPQVRQAIIAPPSATPSAVAIAEQEAATAEANRAAAAAEVQRLAAAQEAQRAAAAAQEAQRSAAQALAAAQTTSTSLSRALSMAETIEAPMLVPKLQLMISASLAMASLMASEELPAPKSYEASEVRGERETRYLSLAVFHDLLRTAAAAPEPRYDRKIQQHAEHDKRLEVDRDGRAHRRLHVFRNDPLRRGPRLGVQ